MTTLDRYRARIAHGDSLERVTPIPGFFLLSVPVAVLGGPTAAQLSWLPAIPAAALIPRAYRARAEVPTA